MLNLVAAATICAVVLLPRGLARAAIVEVERAGAVVATAAVTRAWTVAALLPWQALARRGRSARALAIGRGLAIAVPLVVIFAALFASSDAVFGDALGDLVPSLDRPLVHAATIAVFAWGSAGLLFALSAAPLPREEGPNGRRLGATELGIVLASLDALFLAFVVVQLRTWFGGDDFVQRTTGLTYAEYARGGFFELLVVAALTVLVLLAADHLRRGGGGPAFLPLALLLVGLVAVVMLSALQRMRLYVEAYGLTEARLYATAFMLWLAVVLAWLAATVLRGRRELFAGGAVVAALAGVVVLNALNPDAVVVRTNFGHGRELDASALAELSADATPALVDEVLAAASAGDRPRGDLAFLARELASRVDDADERDARSWRWSTWRADRALRAHAAELAELGGR